MKWRKRGEAAIYKSLSEPREGLLVAPQAQAEGVEVGDTIAVRGMYAVVRSIVLENDGQAAVHFRLKDGEAWRE